MTERDVAVVLLDPDGNDRTPAPQPRLFSIWYGVPQTEVRIKNTTASTVTLEMLAPSGVAESRSHIPDDDLLHETSPDVPVGDLPLLTYNPDSHMLETVPVRLPTPPPFSDSAVDEMWLALANSEDRVRRFLARQATWHKASGIARASEAAVSAAALERTFAAARHLLAHWPQDEALLTVFRPIELSGGREDLASTMRRLPSLPVGRIADRTVPLFTARSRSAARDWHLQTVSWAATELVRRLRTGELMGPSVDDLVAPIERIALRLAPEHRRHDPPPSAWPWPLRHFHSLLLEALAAVIADTEGNGYAPLSHLWHLYQAWVTAQVMNSIEKMLGRRPDLVSRSGHAGDSDAAWVARWNDDEQVTEVWSQFAVGAEPRVLCEDGQFWISSVTALLEPDVLIAVRRDDEARVLAVDAKDTRRQSILPGVVATTGSKYSHGLRVEHHGLPAEMVGTVIVSCAKPIEMYSSDASRIWSVEAHPDFPDLAQSVDFGAMLKSSP